MPQKLKENPEPGCPPAEPESEEAHEDGVYYYDDAHGYQTYKGDEDDDQFEDDDEAS